MRLHTSFVLGYHGCDRAVAEKILGSEEDFVLSDRDFDWLGPGVYFWESDPRRAAEWAFNRPPGRAFSEPYVLGAVIDLGNCLDLTVREDLELLAEAYRSFSQGREKAGLPMPQNEDFASGRKGDKLLRRLDCAVIRHLHTNIDEAVAEAEAVGQAPVYGRFDTVRGLFVEGDEAYPGAGFNLETHTQIAVREPAQIKGVFRPRN